MVVVFCVLGEARAGKRDVFPSAPDTAQRSSTAGMGGGCTDAKADRPSYRTWW